MSKSAKETLGNNQVDELCENMELVGPGQMLADARIQLKLSVEDIAEKLKFKKNLVENIEQDVFDQTLPATYNRGYLRSYAKLVNVDVNEVLSAYEMLGVAEVQRSEMQSFSNLTEKQAEHSRLMWLSYLIVAILLGLMVLWWLQTPQQKNDVTLSENQKVIKTVDADSVQNNQAELIVPDNKVENNQQTQESLENAQENNDATLSSQTENTITVEDEFEPDTALSSETESLTQSVDSTISSSDALVSEENPQALLSEENQDPVDDISTAVFTFSGDCWVNIYDNTGERVAWGVKKSGYVMTVTGQAPFKVTLGKPELATIVFNGQPIDMSPLNVGNIAKFTLPINL